VHIVHFVGCRGCRCTPLLFTDEYKNYLAANPKAE